MLKQKKIWAALLIVLLCVGMLPASLGGAAVVKAEEYDWVDGTSVDTPEKGKAYYFDFSTGEQWATDGATFGLITMNQGTKHGLWWHSAQYGMGAKEAQFFEIQVPGNCYIVVAGDSNSSADATITPSSATGTFDKDVINTKASGHCDLEECKAQGGNSDTAKYTGEAGVVTLTLNASTAYISAICVITEADTVDEGGVVEENPKTWDFYSGNGYTDTIQGTTGEYDSLKIDATNGKLAHRAGSDSQFNAGTIISVPVTRGGTINVIANGGASYANYTIGGQAATSADETVTYTYSGTDGEVVYIDIIATGNSYIKSITRTYSEESGEPGGGSGDETPADELLTLEVGSSETADFTSDLFGQTGAITEGTVIMSPDKYIEATVPSGSTVTPAGGGNHGLALEKEIEFRVKVPANAMGALRLTECQYASASMIVKKDNANGETIVDATSIKSDSDKQDVVVCRYINDTDEVQELYIKLYSGGTGYVHGMTWEVIEIPLNATVIGTAPEALNGENLIFEASDGTEVVVGIASGMYAMELPVGDTYKICLEKGIYKLTSDDKVDLTEASAGDMVTGPALSYEELANRLVLDAEAVTWNFKDTGFGAYGHTATTWYSGDGLVIDGVFAPHQDGSHGASTNTRNTFTINVPAGKTTITFNGCQYDNKTTVNLACGNESVDISLAKQEDGVDPVVPVTFTTDADASIVITVTAGGGYLHSMSAKTETVVVSTDALLAPAIGTSESADFTSDLFGQTGAIIEGTVIMSPDKYIEATVPSGSTVTPAGGGNHGLALEKEIEFRVKVPANAMGVLTFKECMYASASMIVKKDNADGETIVDATSIKSDSDKQDVEVCKYINDTDEVQELYIKLYSGNIGYVHGMTWAVAEIPLNATVSGTVTPAISSENLIFEATDGTKVVAAVTDGQYSVELPVGDTYKVYFEKGIYKVTSGDKVDLSGASAGDAVAGPAVAYEELANRLVLDANETIWNFQNAGFGAYGHTTSTWYSGNGLVIDGAFAPYQDGTHGAATNTRNTFTINVPAGLTTITFNGCQYDNKTAVSITCGNETKEVSLAAQTSGVDPVIPVTFTTDADASIVITVTAGGGYLHSMSAKTETVQPVATVTGTVDAAVNGEVLNFIKDGATVATATIADGKYSVELSVGSNYTVAFANSDTYEMLTGATVDLTEAAVGSTVTNDITYVAWDAAKAFSIKIGDTTFNVTPGSSKAADFVAAAVEGSGSVELSTEAMAVVWADLGGNGKGVLSSNNVTAVSDNITVAFSGNVITVTYNDDTTNPTVYQMTVKDNSASGVPNADGTPINYDFKDGSVISKLYTNNRRLAGGNSVKSVDGLIKLTGQSGIYYNGSHGIYINAGDSISVNVAGDATVSFTLCAYAGADGKITVSGLADGGSVNVESVDAKVATDGESATFEYTGEATTLVFTYSGKTGYIHDMSVTNKVKASTEANPQDENPVVKDYASSDKLEVIPNGQRLILTQTGGSMKTVDGAIDGSVTYFGFDATSECYKLEADVVLNTCGASNSNGIYFGAFDGTNVATVAIRNSTGLRGIYSKKPEDMAGAGIIDKVIEAGQKVHFEAQKTSDGLVITATPEGGETYTATYKYNNSGHLIFKDNGINTEVSYGFVVANASATITNMKYYKADGTCVYNQNDCYAPEGTLPVVSSVTSEANEYRDAIIVSWTSSTAATGDGRYVVEVSKDGGEWTLIEETMDVSLVYPITEAGAYSFRVCGKLGEEGECNEWAVSEALNVIAAMKTPEVSISATATKISLDWAKVNGAVKYEVYRYSYDEGAENVTLVATVTNTEYTDTDVTAEVPYYYSVKAYSDDNCSNPSEYVWAVPSDGHTGYYSYEDEATEIVITKKSYDTVFSKDVVLEGFAKNKGRVEAVVNGNVVNKVTVAADELFSFALTVEEGRNDVELIFTDTKGRITRKVYNFVYLTNYDIVVDAAYTGEAGAEVNGIPTYSTVQAAVDSVSDNNNESVVILVMSGSYNERLVVTKPYISIIGEDRESTLIHCYPADLLGSDYEAGGDMTKRCATYVMSGAIGFSAENISFANDYVYATPDGKSNKSADAFRCDADKATFVNVKFNSVQDTLYMHSGHQYYYKCRIEGLVDFIYSGDAARCLFNDCEIVFVYENGKKSGYVTAPRTAADATYGLTFYNCVITSEEGCTGDGYLLARPWGADAYATWINCYMGEVLFAELPYNNMSGNAYADARFFEFGSYGPGYAINSERRQISPDKAAEMVTDSYLGWLPAGVSAEIADTYIGDVVTDREPQYDINDVVIPEPEPEVPEYDDADEDEENRERIEAMYWSGVAGWKQVGNDWYYFDATGSLETGWVQDADDKWYYMNDNGKMATNWVKSPESGLWYYMDKDNGHMLSNGWLCDAESNLWYYLDTNGAMCTGWIQLDGVWYLLDNNGSMCTGWNMVNGKWYLLGNSGEMLTGWQQVGGKYYYMTSDGDCLINTTTPDGHKVDENGARVD